MEPYRNIAGDSGIEAFELRENAIVVKFSNGATYLYNDQRPGRIQVQRMKLLAEQGKGLCTFISRYIRENYAEQLS